MLCCKLIYNSVEKFAIFLDKCGIKDDKLKIERINGGFSLLYKTLGGQSMNTTAEATLKREIEQYTQMLGDWMPKNATIVVAQDGKYIYCASNAIPIHLQVGALIHPNSIAARVLMTEEKTEALMDETIFGTPYYCLGYPIQLQGRLAALMIVLDASFIPTAPKSLTFITGKHNDDWIPVPIDTISHIESLQKHTWFYVNREAYKTSITLKELQTRLPQCFMRIHRSYIVNISFIQRIKRDFTSSLIVVLKNGLELPVSQSYVPNVRKILEF